VLLGIADHRVRDVLLLDAVQQLQRAALMASSRPTGCERVSTQRGVIMTGRRVTLWRSISNEALPCPMIIPARTYASSGTRWSSGLTNRIAGSLD
jgi:hypothetical protein